MIGWFLLAVLVVIGALLVDHLGLVGCEPRPITLGRIIGGDSFCSEWRWLSGSFDTDPVTIRRPKVRSEASPTCLLTLRLVCLLLLKPIRSRHASSLPFRLRCSC